MGETRDSVNTKLAAGCHTPPKQGTTAIQARGDLFKMKGTLDGHIPGPSQPLGRNWGVKSEKASKTRRTWLGKDARAEPCGTQDLNTGGW